MKRQEFIEHLAGRSGLTRRDIEHMLDAMVDIVGDLLAEGDRLTIKGLGTFTTKELPTRMGRNPRTGERISLPPTTIPVFHPSQVLKDRLNQLPGEFNTFPQRNGWF